MDVEGIFAIIGVFGGTVAIVWIVAKTRFKRHQLQHEERMLALEKGVDIPMDPPRHKDRMRNPYLWPAILIAVGIAFLIKNIWEGDTPGLAAFIPLLMGVGMLIAHIYYAKKHPKMLEENGNGNGNENETEKTMIEAPTADSPADDESTPITSE